ncbi:hypothetical protein EVAR_10117_1 [Eumeta japonica]|uniref:Uncharacterized protein n=1 Tax=Eumeta variegata TaxID=151549 RepID=A0A4C1UDJ2_EUMVA|nr:hypothetical protein EVAR_10117_1 [Eumeta japonica]
MNAYLLNIQIFRRELYSCDGAAAITYAFCAEDPEIEPGLSHQVSNHSADETHPPTIFLSQIMDLDIRRAGALRGRRPLRAVVIITTTAFEAKA